MTPQGFAKTPSATPHRVRSRSQPFGEEGLWSYGEDVGGCAYECGGGVGEYKCGRMCELCWYTNAIQMSSRFGIVDHIQE